MIKFFKSVGHEMKLVHWPSFKENRRDTSIVVTFSILFGLYLGGIDYLLSWLIGML
ncbi:preprotein translocase subunit SecE [Lactobacillus corticis]|uniref:Protein translocase subunit SecE n=1 Tax=Lactobacillus corticis TaxID=2201249 RepID=A0A916QKL1_9LACO|nr:preprotein translocase subunit SecE [Lactobacillus corticis]GFZ27280.1 preprotein translocase subunit SecE [Lactobacillus corticis]